MSHEVSGGCLCSRVRFTPTAPSREIGACWCTQCLRQSIGPWFDVPSAEDMVWEGKVSTYRAADHATRGVCARCGSTLYREADGEEPALSHGAMDDRDGWRPLAMEHEDTPPDACRVVAAHEGPQG